MIILKLDGSVVEDKMKYVKNGHLMHGKVGEAEASSTTLFLLLFNYPASRQLIPLIVVGDPATLGDSVVLLGGLFG
jgi:hypothetical protein